METGTVCEALMKDRHLVMTLVGLSGACLLFLAAAGAAGERKKHHSPATS